MYEIERDEFCEVFDNDFVEFLLDNLYKETFISTDSFVIYLDYKWEEITILLKDSLFSDTPVAINWYKPTHIGRALQLSGIKDKRSLQHYRDMLAEDINYEKKKTKKDK